MKGTLLNAGAVAAGACLGLAVGRQLPPSLEEAAMAGLGLVVSLIGVKMFFESKSPLMVVGSIAVGGILGAAFGLTSLLDAAAEAIRSHLGGGSTFNEALITTTVLFCVGPMTILGCLQDALEGKIELLATKSMLDGVGSIFFAATLGVGVLVTALVVLVVQGCITLCAKPLSRVLSDPAPIAEATAVGGAMMLGIGLNLLGIKHLRVEVYLPGLVLAPLFCATQARVKVRQFAKRRR
jgi:uncharacterized membrane protein YqgA involved in biofilm formation